VNIFSYSYLSKTSFLILNITWCFQFYRHFLFDMYSLFNVKNGFTSCAFDPHLVFIFSFCLLFPIHSYSIEFVSVVLYCYFLPTEKENLCLSGFPSEQWEVNLPAEEVPPELPEPALGINFARDGMQEKDWLSLVAVHSDAWLLSVAFYFGARFGFDKADR
jgi:hypothetical protein